MIGTCVSYQRRFRFDSDVALQLDNITYQRIFQYSLCRLAGNQSAVDLTNLHIIWGGRSSPISGVSSSGKT